MPHPFTYLTSAALTDMGRRRKNNEDSLVMLPSSGIFCVADGMGGAQGGEVASQAAVESLQRVFEESPDAPFALTAKAAARLAARALNQASQWIKNRADERGLTGCGSTAVLLVFDRATPSQACVLHAGDSRAYLCRAGKLLQLSTDHSVAAAAGLPDDATLPAMFRGVITRAVGLESTVLLEETPTDVQAGDLFLLCSDGLTKMVSDKHLQKLLHKHRAEPVEALTQLLVDEALKAGGEDNVSVILVRVADTLPQAPALEIPPQTLALETADVTVPVTGMPPVDDSEAPTRDTGETADTAGNTPDPRPEPASDNPAPITPPTPCSNPGVTPATSPANRHHRPRARSFLVPLLILLAASLALLLAFYLGVIPLHFP